MANNIELAVHHAENITKTVFKKQGAHNWIDLVITCKGGDNINLTIYAEDDTALDRMSTQLGLGLVRQGNGG